MAIGSVGQYLEDNTVENVIVDDVKASFLSNLPAPPSSD